MHSLLFLLSPVRQSLALKIFTRNSPVDPEPLESHCLECLDEGTSYQACTASGQVRWGSIFCPREALYEPLGFFSPCPSLTPLRQYQSEFFNRFPLNHGWIHALRTQSPMATIYVVDCVSSIVWEGEHMYSPCRREVVEHSAKEVGGEQTCGVRTTLLLSSSVTMR